MDIQINCKDVQVSRAYGDKISVTLENIDVNDISGEEILKAIGIEAFIDTFEPDNILDYMGDEAAIVYLAGKGYNITS